MNAKQIEALAIKIATVTNTPIPPIKEMLEKELPLILAEELKDVHALCDQAERAFDKVLECHAKGRDAIMYTPRIDGAHSSLKSAREEAGRELPKEN